MRARSEKNVILQTWFWGSYEYSPDQGFYNLISADILQAAVLTGYYLASSLLKVFITSLSEQDVEFPFGEIVSCIVHVIVIFKANYIYRYRHDLQNRKKLDSSINSYKKFRIFIIVIDYIRNVQALIVFFVAITPPVMLKKNYIIWYPISVIEFVIHLFIVISLHVLLLNQHSYVGLEDKLRKEIQEGGIQTSNFSQNDFPKSEISSNETPEMVTRQIVFPVVEIPENEA